MLTEKQRNLLVFIREKLAIDGVSPSFEEMREAIGLKSKSGVHRLVVALEDRGYIRRMKNRARALEVIKFPTKQEDEEEEARKSHPVDYLRSKGVYSSPDRLVQIPVMGRITAGTPIEAVSQQEAVISVPPALLSGIGEFFALIVSGDSMIRAGINDNDIVLVRRQNTADSGDIVVAYLKAQEATLKRLQIEEGTIHLIAENPEYLPRKYRLDDISIQGKAVGLIRNY